MGVTPSVVSKLLAEGLPAKRAGVKGRRSEYDAIRVLRWWRARQAETETSARDRYYEAATEKVIQEIRHREGELVDFHEVDSRWAELTLAARARLLELPATAVQRGVPEEYAQLIEDLIYDALNELAGRPNVES